MENKINIAELLKNCPRGMELYCTMYEDVYFDYIDELNNIYCYIKNEDLKTSITFNRHGKHNSNVKSKCVIFPKGKTTWEGFVPPCKFKNGDVIAMKNACGVHIFIYNNTTDEYGNYSYYVILTSLGKFKINGFCSGRTYRFATEEEKQKLFNAIKANGYKWNSEAKTLEKLIEPKFKVGDRIKHKKTNKDDVYEISKVYDDSYGLVGYTWMIYMNYQDQYELAPNKFDISNLKPFDKVLVRDYDSECWVTGFYSHQDVNLFVVNGQFWKQCIPYKGNECLCGKRNSCNDFYRTW